MTDERIDYSTFQPLVRRINSPDYPENPVPSGLSPADLAAKKILDESSNANRLLAEYLGEGEPPFRYTGFINPDWLRGRRD
jgi:hypothetical protein